MNAHTANSAFAFQLPSLSYVDTSLEEPASRHTATAEPRPRASWLGRRVTALRTWWQERQMRSELTALSDRELMDIGLTRGDLPRVFAVAYNQDLRERGQAG